MMSAPKATVQRHRTIPMTKRDSLSTSGSRLSLISNNSNASNSKHLEEKERSGHKRTRKAQRTDSYKKATQDLSEYSDLCAQNEPRELNVLNRKEERRKYNTLPIGKESNNNEIDISRCSPKSKQNKHSAFVVRNSSVKSGTYPSSDTDESQFSVEQGRKKKSAFKRFKERLALTFKMNDRDRKRRREKDLNSHSPNRKSGRKKSHKSVSHEKERNKTDRNGEQLNHNHTEAVEGKRVVQQSPEKIRKETNIFKAIRESFRRKSPPEYRKQSSNDNPQRNNYEAHNTSSHQIPASDNFSISKGHRNIYYDGKFAPHGNENHCNIDKESDPRKTPGPTHDRYSSAEKSRETDKQVDDKNVDLQEEGVDITTDIFGAIIDPTSQAVCERQHSWTRQRSLNRVDTCKPKGADRSKLRLEGLRKNRPKSFENTPVEVTHRTVVRQSSQAHYARTVVDSHYRYGRGYDLSPEVEFDGPDFADGAVSQDDEIDFADAFIDRDDHKQAVHNVARSLKFIADKLVQEKQRSVTEDEIVKALREIADEIDSKMIQGKSMPAGIPRELLPAMMNIIKAKTYASFVDVIKRETAKTIGWEQVAWYTFLTKSALQITGLGHEVGRRIKARAMRYFTSAIRPFVDSRPYGWESIHEDTDIDSELD